MFSNFIMHNIVPICKGIVVLLGTCEGSQMQLEIRTSEFFFLVRASLSAQLEPFLGL